MQVIAMIPSRWGSTRFEGKPLARIALKPMVQWVVEQTMKADCVSMVVVVTDDIRIASAVRQLGGTALMTRPENRSGTDRVAEAANLLNLAPEDIVVNIQGDQPLLNSDCISEVIHPLIQYPDLGMSTLAYRIVNPDEITNPKDVKVVFDHHGNALYFSRSPIPFARDLPTRHDTYKHLGIYAYRKRFLDIFQKLPTGVLENIEKLEQLRALEYGHPVRIVVTDHDSPEVDVPEDILRIESLIESGSGY
ncbi:MAG: 3-deoxy-manno-octulosonate cytidylyltransferase [Desulfatirhabdiaceae bacterium]